MMKRSEASASASPAPATRKRARPSSPPAASASPASKRSLPRDDEDALDEATELELMDVMVTLRLLRIQSRRDGVHPPPVVLREQLYGVLQDTSQVDQELALLSEAGRIRQLHVTTEGPPAIGLLPTSLYRQLCGEALAAPEDDELRHLFQRLESRFASPSLPRRRAEAFLEDELSRQGSTTLAVSSDEEGGDAADRDLRDRARAALRSLGAKQLLVPRADSAAGALLYFSAPPLSAYVKELDAAQRRVVQMLRARKYKELSVRDLDTQALRQCPLASMVVIDRLAHRNLVVKLETPAGLVVRLAKKK